MLEDFFAVDTVFADDFSFDFTVDLTQPVQPEVEVSPGTIEVTFPPIDGILDVNADPVAQDDAAATAVNEAITLAVLSNDTDADGDPLNVLAVSEAENGTVSIGDEGTVTYTPDADFVGSDSFTYTVFDGFGFDQATVTVEVEGPDAPEGACGMGDSSGFVFDRVNDWYNPAWGGGFNATYEYTVTDASIVGDDLFNWAINSGYTGAGTLSHVWVNGFNGPTNFSSDGSYDIGNVGTGFQPELQVGDTFSVSFQVLGAGFDDADFNIVFSDCDPEPFVATASDVNIVTTPTNDWGSGFLQNVRIENLTNEDIDGWTLLLDTPENDSFTFTNVWGATAETLDNGDILFSNLSWNADLAANQSVSFGFTGDNATADAVMIDSDDFIWV